VHQKKKSPKGFQSKKKGSKYKTHKKSLGFQNDDHSLRDPKCIYGMSINEWKIDAALAQDKWRNPTGTQ
jgi:hypothetical protein